MTENVPLYNSRIIKSYVEYLHQYHAVIDVDPLLKYADIATYQLDDEGHWLTQRQVDRFHEILAETTRDPDISRKVGRFSVTSRASGALGQYLLGFINPAMAYGVLEKIGARLSRGAVLKTRMIGPDMIEAQAILQPGIVEKPRSMGDSQWAGIRRRFLKNRMAVCGMAFIALLVVMFLFGPLIWDASPRLIDLEYGAQGPTLGHPFANTYQRQ